MAGADTERAGGSTLATQIEKFRHSAGGLTTSPLEKLRQMASASLRAYQDGEETAGARRRIVVDYLNSIPLAAAPPWGEVIGIGDALSIWYGADFEETNAILAEVDDPHSPFDARDARARVQAGALAGALRGPAVVLPDPGPRGAARAHRHLSASARRRAT